MTDFNLPRKPARPTITPKLIIKGLIGSFAVLIGWFCGMVWAIMLLAGGIANETGWNVSISYFAALQISALLVLVGSLFTLALQMRL